MALMARNSLDIPEILAMVGKYVPLWESTGPYGRDYAFKPRDMLSCTLVSRHFRTIMLPILWYTFDESAMSAVPTDIIRKYTPFFRMHFGYGARIDYPIDNRPLCTQLVRLSTITILYEGYHAEFIKSNPGLKALAAVCDSRFGIRYSDVFQNLKQLEDLQVNSMGKGLFQLLSSICPTVKKLDVTAVLPTSLEGLVFPKLKELRASFNFPRDATDLLRGCPNVETLSSSTQSPALIPALNTGACPVLKHLTLNIFEYTMETFAEVLESRIGFQSLELRVGSFNARLTTAINHHSQSLTRLSIRWLNPTIRSVSSVTPFIPQMLGTCGALKEVEMSVRDDVVMQLMTTGHWKNPNLVESLTMSSRKGGTPLIENERMGGDVHGWRFLPGYVRRDHKDEYLKGLFEAAEEFSHLRTIKLDDVIYEKQNPHNFELW
ncbi:hypothetical protein BGX34_008100 [Mortierella sp. NVP85]|nr:hypothetical protein BGX34_008100 [Mortierella sp. NVP85]